MRGLPNMVVVSPADDVETRQATFALADWPGPAYMRVGRYPVPRLFDDTYCFAIGKAARLREGNEVVIFATGHIVSKSLAAAEELARDGVDVGVVNVSTIKPLDEIAVREASAKTALVVTAEEHSVIGGLGSAVAECLAEMRSAGPLLRLGVHDCFGESGLADELLEKHGLQPGGIRSSILHRLALLRKA
jgi:transketolase